MITLENYETELNGICIVEVSGEGCANCISMMQLLSSIAKNRSDFTLKHIEASVETMPLLEHFEVDRVPTVLLCDNGKVFARATGYQPEEILEIWIDAKLEEHQGNPL